MTKEEVKRIREEMGLTQGQLARKMDVAVTTIARWEQGVYAPMDIFEKKLNRVYNRWLKQHSRLTTE